MTVIYPPEELYRIVNTYQETENCRWTRVGNDLYTISLVSCGYWKVFYLVDHRRRMAYEIMDRNYHWTHFTADDIDWPSVNKLSPEAIRRAHQLRGNFPSYVNRFDEYDVGMVTWQLTPDPRYYLDDDGFGMEWSEQHDVYAMVDRDLRVLVKFQPANDARLSEMRQEARGILAARK